MRLHFWIAAAHACHGLQPPIIHPATQQLRGLRVESTPAARTGSPRACTRLGKEWLTRPGHWVNSPTDSRLVWDVPFCAASTTLRQCEVPARTRLFTWAGIGIVFGSLIHSVSRNPSLSKQLFGYAILGFALSEAMALFALLVAFLILFGLIGFVGCSASR